MTLAMGEPGVVQPWVDPTKLAADQRLVGIELPDGITVADCVQAASETLFKLVGSRFPGLRTDKIRPHRLGDDCQCDLSGMNFGGWGWTGIGGWWNRIFPEGWGCGCIASAQLQLPGGSVTNILEVQVDGVVLDASTYQVYDNRRLVRMIDTVTASDLSWPCCQLINRPLGEPGTWSVTYQHGAKPPMAGILAAWEFSIQTCLYVSGTKLKLPQRAQRTSRQGIDVTIEAGSLLNDGKTGFPLVDTFLQAYNPHKLKRRAAAFSPDSVQSAIVETSQP